MSTSTTAMLVALAASNTRNPFPVSDAIRQAASDRLTMAGDHLRTADRLAQEGSFRSSISRHYYAMYHTARAVVFAYVQGDDHQRHNQLARHLPISLQDRTKREAQLTDARLLRNEADYEAYPLNEQLWEPDARTLTITASEFVASLEDFALNEGLL